MGSSLARNVVVFVAAILVAGVSSAQNWDPVQYHPIDVQCSTAGCAVLDGQPVSEERTKALLLDHGTLFEDLQQVVLLSGQQFLGFNPEIAEVLNENPDLKPELSRAKGDYIKREELILDVECPIAASLGRGTPRTCSIGVYGELVSGRTDVFVMGVADALNKRGVLVDLINLNSPGGDVSAGIALARFVHNRRIQVVVPGEPIRKGPARPCASACTFIYLAGSFGRFTGSDPYQKKIPSFHGNNYPEAYPDLLQFHSMRLTDNSASRVSDSGYVSSMKASERTLRDFFSEVDVPDQLWSWAATIPSNQTRPLPASLWQLAAQEYPPELRELLLARCGALKDDVDSVVASTRPTIENATSFELRLSEAKKVVAATEAWAICELSVIRPFQEEAQLRRFGH